MAVLDLSSWELIAQRATPLHHTTKLLTNIPDMEEEGDQFEI